MNVLKYILHGFSRNVLRTILAVLSVFFMFTMMVAISLFFSSAQETDFDSINRQVAYDIEIVRVGHTDLNPRYLDVGQVEEKVGEEAGITGLYPVLRGYGFTTVASEPSHFFSLYGVEEEYDIGVVDFSEGDYELEEGKCVISRSASLSIGETVGKSRAEIGESFEIHYPTRDGIVNSTLEISGIYDIRGRYVESSLYRDIPYIVVDLRYLQNLTGLEGEATQIMITVDQGLYDLSDPANPSRDVQRVARSIARVIGEDYDVTAPKADALEKGSTGFLSSLSYLFAILLPAISGILVASVMNLSVEEKSQEIATLRLLGAKRHFVGKVVITELFGILLMGMIPALIIGPLLANAIIFLFGLDFRLTSLELSLQLTLQIVIAVIVSVLFSISPILKALRTHPSESINRVKSQGTFKFVSTERVDRKLVFSGWFVFGSMMIAIFSVVYLVSSPGGDTLCFSSIALMTLLPISLSIALLGGVPYLEDLMTRGFFPVTRQTNKIIRSYIKRNVRRNISTNLIFGTIVAILIMFSSIFSSFVYSSSDMIRDSIGSDIRVFMATSGMREDDIGPIEDIEGVSAVSGLAGPVNVQATDLIIRNERGIFAYGIDESLTDALYMSRARFSEGGPSDLRSLGEDGVALSEGLAKTLEVGRGDDMSIVADWDGREKKKMYFEIKAVVSSMPGFLGGFSENSDHSFQSALFSIEGYARVRGVEPENVTFSSLFIDPVGDDDKQHIVDRLNERFGASDSVFIVDTDETIDMATASIVILNVIMTVISVLLLIVAIFSLVINLYASIKEREYGIGVLKSMGLRNFEVMKSLMVEGVVIAVVSMCMGVISGLAVAYIGIYAFNSISMVRFDFYPPWIIIVILTLITFVFGTIGSLFPAFAVSRKEVINLMKKTE